VEQVPEGYAQQEWDEGAATVSVQSQVERHRVPPNLPRYAKDTSRMISDNSTSIIARYKAENILAYQEGKAAKVAAPATISQHSLPSQNRVGVSTGQKVAVALVRSLFGYTLQRLGRQAAELR
jgi:hypothetical protein